jgi:hypothetical protein
LGTRKLAAALAQVQQDCQIRQSFADAEPTHRSEAREEDLGARTQVLEQMVDYFSTLRDDYSSRLDELKQKQELQAQEGKTRPPPRARIFGGRKPKPKAPAGNVGDEMKQELTATLEKAALQLETTLTRKVSTDHVEAPTPEVEDPDAEEAEGAEDPEDPEDAEEDEQDEQDEQDEDEDEEDEEDEVEELEDEDLDEDEEPEELDEEQERGKAGAEVPYRTEDADDAPDAGLGGTLRLEDPVVEDPAVETKPLEDEAPQPEEQPAASELPRAETEIPAETQPAKAKGKAKKKAKAKTKKTEQARNKMNISSKVSQR